MVRGLAEQGDGEAQLRLGLMYLVGQAVPADLEEGRFWLREAALQQVIEAQISLATSYAQTEGKARDLVEAYAWLSIAAQRSEIAQKALKEIGEDLSEAERQQALDQARKYADRFKVGAELTE